MCGRYGLDATVDDLAGAFEIDLIGEGVPAPLAEARPTDAVPVVLESERSPGRRLEAARWDLARPRQKELRRPGPPLINVRAETLADKFGWAVQRRRCQIPATGYWEWTGPKGARQPYFFHGPDVLAFAGVYSWWRDPAKDDVDPSRWVLTAALLTMDAVARLAPIHDRNPVLLPADAWDDWLDPTALGTQALVEAAVAEGRGVAEALDFAPVPRLR
jgi:putative SOS response-associated peptidase YedK